MGSALEIGWVNKERVAVSRLDWFLLTVLFALSLSLLLFPLPHPWHPHDPQPRFPPVSFAPPSPLLTAFSTPPSAPACPLFSDCCTVLIFSPFPQLCLCICQNCGISRWISLLICVITPVGCEIVHWLRCCKNQWYCSPKAQFSETKYADVKTPSPPGTAGVTKQLKNTEIVSLRLKIGMTWSRSDQTRSECQSVLKCHPVTERSALTFSHDALLLSCFV